MGNNDQLILEQQPYVRALARNIAKSLPSHVDYDELVAFGQLGLVEAAKQFDVARGVSFTTFAHYRIRGAIFDGLRKMTWLPPAARRHVQEQSATNDLLEANAAKPAASDDPEYLARQFSDAVERLGAVYLISNVRDGERAGDDPPDRRATPQGSMELKELRGRLNRAVESLPEDEAALIRMLYIEGKSMSEVGESLGKNKSTVSRRHADAIDRLRALIGGPNRRGTGPPAADRPPAAPATRKVGPDRA